MTKLTEITHEEYNSVVGEFYAEPIHRNKMTEEEIIELAKRLNEKFDVPIIDETKEEKIFIKIILKIDNFLYDNLPNEFYGLLRSTENGIDDKEAIQLISRLTKLANNKIDIPILSEKAEEKAIKFVIGIVVNASRKTLNFNKVLNNSDKLVITESNDKVELMALD